MLTDQGIIEGISHELLLYRKNLGANKTVKIFADILVKHAVPLGWSGAANNSGSNKSEIVRIAKDTQDRALADALIISGAATGEPPTIDDLKAVRAGLPDCQLLAGSGVNKENIGKILDIADGVIVASALKQKGLIENPIDIERVKSLLVK
jgi:membrane complex biogenesis BtpA family protein